MNTIFETLKNETSFLHREIENYVPVMREGFSQADYKKHLLKLVGFYAPLEKELERASLALDNPFDIRSRLKLDLLKADLAALGVCAEEISSQPHCQQIHSISSLGELIGSMYVIEGSTLGAQIIRKVLLEKVKVSEEQIQFYTGYGPQTGKMWQGFKQKGTDISQDRDVPEAVGAAQGIFKSLTQWLKH